MIELDVWLTKDNQIAVLHDGELERTTGVKGHINAFAYKDLPALLPTSMSTSNVHLRDLHIPLLEDVIREMPNKQFPIIVEVKQHSRQLVEMLDELLNRHKQLQGFVVWFSLDAGISNLLNEVNPQRPRIFSVKHVVLTYIFHYMGILPFIPTSWVGGSEAAVIFGFKVGDVGEGLLRKIPLLKTASVSMLTTVNRWVKGISVNASLVEHLRKRGIITYVLGVNNDEDFQNAVASTSEAFLTDRTEWMRAKLEENRVYCKKMS